MFSGANVYNQANVFVWEYQQRKMLKEMGYVFSPDDLHWHEVRILNIIDREWKQLEANEYKRASKKRR